MSADKKQQLAGILSLVIPYADAVKDLKDDLEYLGKLETYKEQTEKDLDEMEKLLEASKKRLHDTEQKDSTVAATTRAKLMEAEKQAAKLIADAQKQAREESTRILAEIASKVKDGETRIEHLRGQIEETQKQLSERKVLHAQVEASLNSLRQKIT